MNRSPRRYRAGFAIFAIALMGLGSGTLHQILFHGPIAADVHGAHDSESPAPLGDHHSSDTCPICVHLVSGYSHEAQQPPNTWLQLAPYRAAEYAAVPHVQTCDLLVQLPRPPPFSAA